MDRTTGYHLIARLLIVIGIGGLLAFYGLGLAGASSHTAYLLVLDNTIDPISADFLSRGIQDAEKAGAQMIIVQLNTPGGLLESTREMVERIFEAQLPVVVYVAPSGAQAASAGTFISAAAHIAAMAPATNIGAASPVRAGGEDIDETLKAKVTQDTAAFLRSIAAQRNRNAQALEDTVLKSASYTADEALQMRVVDLTADSIDDLLTRLDGMTIDINGQGVTLRTDGINIHRITPTPVERFLSIVANPNIAFLLLTIGGIGIVIELLSPGLLGPGAVGVIALALAFVAFGNLPVNWVGVGLICLAMGLFFMEAQAPGIGIFGISGAVGFLLGAFLLFGNLSFTPNAPPFPDTPTLNLSPWIIAGVSVLLFGAALLTFRAIREAKRAPTYTAATDYYSLIGRTGVTTTQLNPSGSVMIGNEHWSAESHSGVPIPNNENVVVLEMEGLTLMVGRADELSVQEWQ